MEWRDEGTILSARRFGERDAIVSLMTFEHGRHVGLVRGGASRRLRAEFQLGNHVACEWRARLADHLGTFKLEVIAGLRARVIDDPLRLAAVEAVCVLVENCVGERDTHPEICAALISLIRRISERDDWLADVPRFELMLLAQLGYGLELSRCALGGPEDDLAFVSPKSGRAVSRDKALPYAAKLLPLPAYLLTGNEPETTEILEAFRLSGYFLQRRLLDPTDKLLPLARDRLVRHVQDLSEPGPSEQESL